MMNEYTLPGIKLKNTKHCTGCPAQTGHCECVVLGKKLEHDLTDDFWPHLRPANCPLQPSSKRFGIRTMQLIPDESCPKDQFKLIGNNMSLLVSFTNGLTTEKPQPRCGDCIHADDSWTDAGEIYCPFIDRRKPINWYCGDCELKEKG